MAKRARELTALEVRRLAEPGNHCVGGVTGLYLYVNSNGARSWVLRAVVGTKRRHVGLGGFSDVTLAEAREKARQLRGEMLRGIDPVEARKRSRADAASSQARAKTFREAAESYIDAHALSWTNSKHRAQWSSSLKRFAYPVMGQMLVRDLTQEHVLAVLEPIWKTKNETASRLRGRIESVLAWAAVRKYRSEDNPARWKGHLDQLLAAPSKIQKTVHHRSIPPAGMRSFMSALRCQDGIAARALEFGILCASRSGEVRGARWSEIDLEKKIWTVPAERMKASRIHRVPLSVGALHILKNAKRFEGVDFVFPSPRSMAELSDMTLNAVMRRMEVDAVPHGFRSTFRDWVGDISDFAPELAELALAHVLANKTEAAYRRGDGLEKRRVMMESWSEFCG